MADMNYEAEQEQEEGAEYMASEELKQLMSFLIGQQGWLKVIDAVNDAAYEMSQKSKSLSEKKQWHQLSCHLDAAIGLVPR